MSFAVGIGIITFNRRTIVANTVERVRELTRIPDAALVVADDGSSDGTPDMLRDSGIPVITGVNMGIAWNKNRALFLLAHMLHCETVILLEDDTYPVRYGWELDWVLATRRWGHVNLAGDWLSEHYHWGTGTLDDPVLSHALTAQCSAYSRDALTFGGYFHPRFTGYGHEHVAHSRRLLRMGYGGIEDRVDGAERVRYYLIKGDIRVAPCASYYNPEQEKRNWYTAHEVINLETYGAPWETDRQMFQFRDEVARAMEGGIERFRLTPPAEKGGPRSRFFFQA